jgi:arylsulfatase
LDGNDIKDFLQGEKESPTSSFFYFRGKRLEAFRDGKWKYRRSHQRPDGKRSDRLLVELYDLEFDPGERFNLIDRYPETGARMEARLRAFAAEMDAGVWD